MSRLRATLSLTEIDREIQLALDRAAREVEEALRIASASPLSRYAKRRTLGDLQQALEAVSRVSYLRVGDRESTDVPEPDRKREPRSEPKVKEQADV